MSSPKPVTAAASRITLSAAACLLAAGCGGALSGASGGLQLDAGPQAVHTGEPLHLSATASASGEPAQVRWSVVSGNNAPALGNGSISADGVYLPPGMLSRDQITVTIAATPIAQTGAPATLTLTVEPGFAQPLQPENATLSPGSTLEVRAQLAEVSSGTVNWRLEKDPSSPPHELGSLSDEHCDHGSRQFTTCTVTYTAPPDSGASASAVAPRLWLVASTGSSESLPAATGRARLMLGSLNSNPVAHQLEQRGPIALGTSGGNDNDFDTYLDATGTRFVADCCGGTLGALLEDQAGTPYVLSNNHVLATSDQGHPGDPIEQPGLIDDGCVPLTKAGSQLHAIGALEYSAPLAVDGRPTANVDAALAAVRPGAVDAGDAILELGSARDELPGASGGAPGGESGADRGIALRNGRAARGDGTTNTLRSAPPTAGDGEPLDAARLDGLSVVKSGRTTGLTCSTVDAVDLSVSVDYYKDCAETQPYTRRIFTGQIGIGGETFADSGDSGALVLDAANAQPIGLLYATAMVGASSATEGIADGLSLASPISDVLEALSVQAGSPLSVRGTSTPHSLTCLDYDHGTGGAIDRDTGGGPGIARPSLTTLAPDERSRVAKAVDAAATLRASRSPSVLAVAPGVSADDPESGAVFLYIDRAADQATDRSAAKSSPLAPIPTLLAGVRTVVIPSDLATVSRGPAWWPAPIQRPGLRLNAAALASARSTAERLTPQLMQAPAVFGVGVAQSLDNPEEPAILLLIDLDAPILSTRLALAQVAGSSGALPLGGFDADGEADHLPAMLSGMRVRYLRMHRFRVTRSKYLARGTPSSCSANMFPGVSE